MERKDEEIRVGRVYRHFKGTEYTVIGISRDRDNLEIKRVIYEQRYETPKFPKWTLWSRTLEDFLGTKEVNGKTIKRFTLVE